MINKTYINFINIPIVKTKAGKFYCDQLWAKDLKLHFDYISDFRLCCPVIESEEIASLQDISDFAIKKIYPLRFDGGILSVLQNIIPNLIAVKNALQEAEIAHSGCAGWAFPLSFDVLFFRPFLSFQWIVVMESSFWLLNENQKPTFLKILESSIYKVLVGWCLKYADARIFTQSSYRNMFLGTETAKSMINPAVWVDENNILPPDTVKKRFLSRVGETAEFIFPARLIADKGVLVLFEAIGLLKDMNVTANITLVGEGTLAENCREFAKQNHGSVKVSYIQPVSYGEAFFNLLEQYDAVIVPNLKEEQPRIIFDAFSQGVGVVAFGTSGILDITIPGENAIICHSDNAQGLADGIKYLAENPTEFLKLGVNALAAMVGKTHLQMHRDRAVFLQKMLDC